MKKYIFGIILMSIAFGASAQTNTFYFMDEVPTRNSMNPAFIPNTAWYWNVIFPSFYVEGSTGFALKDLVMKNKNNNEWVLALHPSQNVNQFYNRIPSTTEIGTRAGLDIINFGFRIKDKNYFTFDLGARVDAGVYLPKDLFKLSLFGTPDEFGLNKYNLKNLGVNATVYGQLGLGYMRKINDKVNIGFKLKGLVGVAGAFTNIKKATLNASGKEWNFDVQGDGYIVTPDRIISWNEQDTAFKTKDPMYSTNWKDYVQGLGGALDFGITYEPIKNLVISAAVTDLGFIRWFKPQSMVQMSANGNFAFNGIEYKFGNDFDLQALGDSLLNGLKNSTNWNIKNGGKKVNQMITTNVNVGIEYGVLDNKISFGALSNTRINQSKVMEEVTLAVNFRPTDWFKTYFSYTFFDGRYNNIGLGLNLRMGPVNTFLVLDYIPLNWARTSGLYDGQTQAIPLPYGTSRFNVQAGLIFNFGRDSSDKDRDGVRNKKDKCPDTDIKALMALCPDVKRKDFVDKNGCTLDEDKDGVPDCYDRCPGTPEGVPVDQYGCPFDEDGDGVYDYLDKCPNTPAGVAVDENGCPFDTDGDGVPDYLDKCPNTPAAAYGFVDENGCPKDTDGDGVPDYLDQCPNTPAGVQVDANGCPLDSDGDGVPDYLDKCPGTPAAARGYVDANGCPKDTDGDGVPDYLDKCPNTPAGVQVDANGCPMIKASVKKIFEKALQGIQFETGKDVIKPVSFPILNDIVKIMNENPSYFLQINGHTDNVGNPESNLVLSEKRANAVKNYLVNKGVAENRLTAQGFGDTQPVVPNTTAANKAKNRRVEFVVRFEETVTEE